MKGQHCPVSTTPVIFRVGVTASLFLSSLLLFFLVHLVFRLYHDFGHIFFSLTFPLANYEFVKVFPLSKFQFAQSPLLSFCCSNYYLNLFMFIFDTVFLKLTLFFLSVLIVRAYTIVFTLSLEDRHSTHCIFSVITAQASPALPSLLSQTPFPSLQNLFFNISVLFCSLNILHFRSHTLKIMYTS